MTRVFTNQNRVVACSGLAYLAIATSIVPFQQAAYELDLTASFVGLCFMSESVSSFLARFLSPLFTRLLGHRVGFAVGATSMFFACAPVFLSTSWPHLLVSRILVGAGLGICLGVATLWVTNLSTDSSAAGSVAGRVGLVNYVGMVVAAPFSWLFLHSSSAQVAVSLCALFPLCGIALAFCTSEPRKSEDHARHHSEVVSRSAPKPLAFILTSGAILAFSAVAYGTLMTVGPRLIPANSHVPQASLIATYGAVLVAVRAYIPVKWNRFLSSPLGISLALALSSVGGTIAWAGTLPTAFASAALIGLASAIIYPSLMTQIHALSGKYRAHAVASFGSFTVIGYGVGSLMSGFVTDNLSVSVAFLTAGIVSAFGLTLMPLWIKFAGDPKHL